MARQETWRKSWQLGMRWRRSGHIWPQWLEQKSNQIMQILGKLPSCPPKKLNTFLSHISYIHPLSIGAHCDTYTQLGAAGLSEFRDLRLHVGRLREVRQPGEGRPGLPGYAAHGQASEHHPLHHHDQRPGVFWVDFLDLQKSGLRYKRRE